MWLEERGTTWVNWNLVMRRGETKWSTMDEVTQGDVGEGNDVS